MDLYPETVFQHEQYYFNLIFIHLSMWHRCFLLKFVLFFKVVQAFLCDAIIFHAMKI